MTKATGSTLIQVDERNVSVFSGRFEHKRRDVDCGLVKIQKSIQRQVAFWGKKRTIHPHLCCIREASTVRGSTHLAKTVDMQRLEVLDRVDEEMADERLLSCKYNFQR